MLALGGVARDLVREILLEHKLRGAVQDLGDGNGPQQLTGAAFIEEEVENLTACTLPQSSFVCIKSG